MAALFAFIPLPIATGTVFTILTTRISDKPGSFFLLRIIVDLGGGDHRDKIIATWLKLSYFTVLLYAK